MEAEGVIHQVPDDTAAGVAIITSKEVGLGLLEVQRRIVEVASRNDHYEFHSDLS